MGWSRPGLHSRCLRPPSLRRLASPTREHSQARWPEQRSAEQLSAIFTVQLLMKRRELGLSKTLLAAAGITLPSAAFGAKRRKRRGAPVAGERALWKGFFGG